MKKALPFLFMLFALAANAQNYLISFAGTGESTTVASVRVENLTSGESLTLSGADILRLNISTGINSSEIRRSPEMKIYPNPMTENTIIKICPPEEGMAAVSIYDMTGKVLSRIDDYLDNSVNEFRISGISDGLYLVNVKGTSYNLSGKLISKNKSAGRTGIVRLSNNHSASTYENTGKSGLKGVEETVDMFYSSGQTLKFTGTSGNYTTILTDTPSANKTITFNFVDCTDGDGNDYPVIVTPKGEGKAGTIMWMGGNLRTTRYNDGADIPAATGNTEWSTLSTPGYCWFSTNESANKITYGALYNWYTVNTGKLCPAGWRVPTDEEWTSLTNILGGEKVAGGKLKEAGLLHWDSPNTDATNETGFAALPGGYRMSNGIFTGLNGYGKWWSSTPVNENDAWFRYMGFDFGNVKRSIFDKNFGCSIRCVKD